MEEKVILEKTNKIDSEKKQQKKVTQPTTKTEVCKVLLKNDKDNKISILVDNIGIEIDCPTHNIKDEVTIVYEGIIGQKTFKIRDVK